MTKYNLDGLYCYEDPRNYDLSFIYIYAYNKNEYFIREWGCKVSHRVTVFMIDSLIFQHAYLLTDIFIDG